MRIIVLKAYMSNRTGYDFILINYNACFCLFNFNQLLKTFFLVIHRAGLSKPLLCKSLRCSDWSYHMAQSVVMGQKALKAVQ